MNTQLTMVQIEETVDFVEALATANN